MTIGSTEFQAIRKAVAGIPGDVSNDAVGANVAKLEDIYAPETHSAALDPTTPIVVGSRGSGKSFWSSVLGQATTREAAATAYPKLGLDKLDVYFGYTGVGGPDGVSAEAINACVADGADIDQAKAFWWATILSAAERSEVGVGSRPSAFMEVATDWEAREELLIKHEHRLRSKGRTLIVVYDALDTVARTWPRRRLLTEALLEVVWAMRAYRAIRLKLFLRPDQIEDDGLRFVELPKLRTGAVVLRWASSDLYGLLFSRLVLTQDDVARVAFNKLLSSLRLPSGEDQKSILSHRWRLVSDQDDQRKLMTALAGPFMGQGVYANKKGSSYEYPIKHLSDAFNEVTPRSFLGMLIAAAQTGAAPQDRVITPDGLRHGLRAASKTRVDQLHQEFLWIKGVLAPLAGLLLPQEEDVVFKVWRDAKTMARLIEDAELRNYLPPFPIGKRNGEQELFTALQSIGVMFRRKDDRLDMPDLFRVAARLLKKGGIAPTSK